MNIIVRIVASHSPCMSITTTGINAKNVITMNMTKKEIYEDYLRFIRHEAMRANTTQDVILKIINNGETNNS